MPKEFIFFLNQVDYVPKHLSNLINEDGCPPSTPFHYKLDTKAVELKSHEALHSQYQGFLANKKKYQHLSKEFLADPVVEFLLYFAQPCFNNTACISQYGGRFDMIFVLRSCLELGIRCEPLSCGSGLISLTLPDFGLYFVDSYRTLQQPLKLFHKRFNLRPQKGTFPLKFLREETLDYVGPVPPFDQFTLYSDSQEEIEEKRVFWNEIKAQPYFLAPNLMAYCEKDVEITVLGVVYFTMQCLEIQTKMRGLFKDAPTEEQSLNLYFPFHPPKLVTLGGFS